MFQSPFIIESDNVSWRSEKGSFSVVTFERPMTAFFQAMLKELNSGYADVMKNMIYKENPFLSMIKKERNDK